MDALQRLIDANAIDRLNNRDASLYCEEFDNRIPIVQRMGWTDLASKASGRFPLLESLAKAILSEGTDDLVLLGMGGSSLAPLVLSRVIGSAPRMPRMHILDTTSPLAVKSLLDTLDPNRTFFVLASKSGTTLEPLSLYAIFRQWMEATMLRPAAGRRFIIITDPGSPLEKLRQRELMRVTLSAPATVGGRYSALSMFGLAPAALIGIDVPTLIERAAVMEEACKAPAEQNPGALLAAWMTDRYEAQQDKLTLVCSPTLRSFGLWIEQLVAESLGKGGKGIVPVVEQGISTPTGYGPDRAVVVIRYADDEDLRAWSKNVAADSPVFELVLSDSYDIGVEFLRWEYAVALTGFLMGVNPFDEPNVTEAKKATTAILAGESSAPRASADLGGTWVTYAGGMAQPTTEPTERIEALRALFGTLQPGDYLAVLAYLPEDETLLMPLRTASRHVADSTGTAVCLELGPRYLHSTGQLHKGGPNTGVFLVVTTRDHTDYEIPKQSFGLSALHRAQAEGDLVTLAARGRRVMRLDLPGATAHDVAALADDLAAAAEA
ncbi:MAG: glucose-6-phosphate isomerase [Coriobacteriia bacterium]|nr:glucose-6-phosphate isomerase [Coriobacteriia bacterium]